MLIAATWDTSSDDESAEPALPREIEVPDDVPDDEVADWLSDKYGFLVQGWARV